MDWNHKYAVSRRDRILGETADDLNQVPIGEVTYNHNYSLGDKGLALPSSNCSCSTDACPHQDHINYLIQKYHGPLQAASWWSTRKNHGDYISRLRDSNNPVHNLIGEVTDYGLIGDALYERTNLLRAAQMSSGNNVPSLYRGLTFVEKPELERFQRKLIRNPEGYFLNFGAASSDRTVAEKFTEDTKKPYRRDPVDGPSSVMLHIPPESRALQLGPWSTGLSEYILGQQHYKIDDIVNSTTEDGRQRRDFYLKSLKS